jgi:hypothetical protein
VTRFLSTAGLALGAAILAAAGLAPAPVAAQTPRGVFVGVDDVVDPIVLPASEVEYVVEVVNFAQTPVSEIAIDTETPEGTVFGEASTSAGTIEAPARGERGAMRVLVGTLVPGASAQVRFELGLEAGAGPRLDFAASVTSDAGDPISVEETTFVVDAGDPVLRWAPASLRSTPGDTDPTPRMVRVERPVAPLFLPDPFPIFPTPAGLEYRVYRAATPEGTLLEENLVETLPGTQQNTGRLDVPGFYAVRAVLGGVRSAASMAVSIGLGEPTIATLSVKKGALKADGENFDRSVVVTVDGVGFARPASVTRGGTRVTQSGKLENGRSLKRYLAEHPAVLFCFRNANGSVSCAPYGLFDAAARADR